jgi:3-isopropylmalate/(R)-2-methylmalate dehydratase small subunit
MKAPFTAWTGVAAPLPRDNIDTDLIIRVEPLFGGVAREDLGPYALAGLRFDEHGAERADFILNRGVYRSASMLVTGANFGCGSSREGAVWALMAAGIRCIIAPSFGDIFYANCFQNGLLPVRLAQAQVDLLMDHVRDESRAVLKVDLRSGTLTAPGLPAIPFSIAARRREGLLRGLDDLELTLARSASIDAFQRRDRVQRSWIYETAAAASARPGAPPTHQKEDPA